MPGETGTVDAGFGAPARKRRGAQGAAGSSADGDPKPEGREPEPERRTESVIEPAFGIVDPLNLPADSGGAGDHQPRRRGRPRGSVNKKEEAVSNLTALLKIERLLATGCFFLGNIASAPELYITEAEAAEVGEALKELSKHYPIGMSEKTIAWVNLSFAVGGVFGPKIVAVYKRRPVKTNRETIRSVKTESNGISTSPMVGPELAKTPSEMWPQTGDIEEVE